MSRSQKENMKWFKSKFDNFSLDRFSQKEKMIWKEKLKQDLFKTGISTAVSNWWNDLKAVWQN